MTYGVGSRLLVRNPLSQKKADTAEAVVVSRWQGGESHFKREIRVPLGAMYVLRIDDAEWVVPETTLEEMLWTSKT